MKLLQKTHVSKEPVAYVPQPTTSISYANCAGMMASNSSNSSTNWIIDTGASDHMCHDELLFTNLQTLSKPFLIGLPNGQNITINKIRIVHLTQDIVLQHVLIVPQFKHNLLSVSRICHDTHGILYFTDQSCMLQAPSLKRPLVLGNLTRGLYILLASNRLLFDYAFFTTSHCNSVVTSTVWHQRLGHLPCYKMKQLPINSNNSLHFLEHCDFSPQARQHKLPFPHSTRSSIAIFDLIHVDVWGPLTCVVVSIFLALFNSPISSFKFMKHDILLSLYTHVRASAPIAVVV
ncbi:putative RNA-directed DNA polymerase [Helianthus annuus]|nr:putative RNA-directed DNA polymerase [Helianthus annuus]